MKSVGAVLVALALAGCSGPASTAPPAPGSDAKGPDWSFSGVDGATYSRDLPEGNATVLFFMATWCGSCRSKAPVLAEVVPEYADTGLRVYSVDFDASETAEDLRAWQEQYDQHWPHGTDPGLRTQRALGVRIQSTVVVLDADGHIVEHFGYGEVTAPALRDAIDRALAPRSA